MVSSPANVGPGRGHMEIDYLSNHRYSISQITDWFHNEWSHLYPDRTRCDFETIVRMRASPGEIPFALVALNVDGVVGTVSLRMHDAVAYPGLGPWLSGLYVTARWRGLGIGTKLVEAMEKTASGIGFSELFLCTPIPERFYSRLGWHVLERAEHCRDQVVLMKRDLALQGRVEGIASAEMKAVIAYR